MVDGGVRLYLVPTVSVGFLKLVMEQWPRLQRNTNGVVCNLSLSVVVPADRGLLLRTLLCYTHSYIHSMGTMRRALCYSHYKS